MNQVMSSKSSAERLIKAGSALNMTLQATEIEKLLHYVDQLHLWNKTYNLTAVRNPDAMLVQHIFDCLSVIKPLETYLAKVVSPQRTVLDVGSGAGLPGIVIATMMPNTQVECVDTVEKKASFIRQMAGVLELPNLIANHARIEQLPPKSCSVVISRAFASIQDFIAVAGQHVGAHGALVAMKGLYPGEELKQIETNNAWALFKTEELKIPELNAHRCMIWLTRNPQP